ncbi:hypothetical protein [Cumulibacter soli]|uniref:hypothetical protein n=1 Tax=Cumulibacter soli TaxID=2546344 RepID=UPI0010684C63|nr:hypothetical protein [Cumulibacter soli]
MRTFTSRVFGGAIVATAAVTAAMAIAGPAGAAPASAATSSAYVAEGSLLGSQIASVFPVSANEDAPTAEAGADDEIIGGILHLTAVHSEANVDVATGTADAEATIAGASIDIGGALLGTGLRLDITAIAANCAIAEDGTATAGNDEPVITLTATVAGADLPAITIPMVDGVADIGYGGVSLGTVSLGQADTDYSDGVVSSDGVQVELLTVGDFQGASVTLAHAECGPVVPVEDIPVASSSMLLGAGAVAVLALGGYQLVMMARRRDA